MLSLSHIQQSSDKPPVCSCLIRGDDKNDIFLARPTRFTRPQARHITRYLRLERAKKSDSTSLRCLGVAQREASWSFVLRSGSGDFANEGLHTPELASGQ